MTQIIQKALLRFDVSAAVGLGHMRRMCNIAACLTDVRYVVGKSAGQILQAQGLPAAQILEIDPTNTTWLREVPNFDHIITDICYDKNKSTAEAEILRLTQTEHQVCVIDSMPPDHFAPQPASGDIAPRHVITPYLSAEHLRPKPFAENWHTGPGFCVLDPQYTHEMEQGLTFPKEPRILLCCGGSDPTHLTLRSLQALSEFSGQVDVVIGPLFSSEDIQELRDYAGQNSQIALHHQPDGLATLINSSNLVVGRPGLIRYETAALHRHGIFLSEIESYYEYFKGFEAAGLAELFFSIDLEGEHLFFKRLRQVSQCHAEDKIFLPNQNTKKYVSVHGTQDLLKMISCA